MLVKNFVEVEKVDEVFDVMSLRIFEASSDLFENLTHLNEIELHFRLLNLELSEGLLHGLQIDD